VFILTTLDAGTRVGRFMVQDALGHVWKPLGQTSWYPSVLIASFLVVAGWGYFLYMGVIDPYGGINILWPLFGIANQMLAGIALAIATTILIKSGRGKYAWVTALPLTWVAIVTTTAAWQKIFSDDPRHGFLAGAADLAAKAAAGTLSPERLAIADKLIFNQRICALLAGIFLVGAPTGTGSAGSAARGLSACRRRTSRTPTAAATAMTRPAAPMNRVLAMPARLRPPRRARTGPAQHATQAAAPMPRTPKPSFFDELIGRQPWPSAPRGPSRGRWRRTRTPRCRARRPRDRPTARRRSGAGRSAR